MKPLPDTVLGLIELIEAEYPPRCKHPEESLECHMLYAGSVLVGKELRARYEANLKRDKTALPKVIQ
jgi:hypothetical protein